MSVLVTGGAGFIGSNLVNKLISGNEETFVIDNLSAGKIEALQNVRGNSRFHFSQTDLLHKEGLVIPRECSTIFHLAANPEVRLDIASPEAHFNQNVVATFNLLEASRKADVQTVCFTSTSTIYGEASKVPTPEDYAPLEPISMYGASKLACESIIMSYSHLYGIKSIIFRLANIIGPDSTHGVIYDFVNKIRRDPTKLEVLGDGTQNKSYLHISDCVAAIDLARKKAERSVNVFNIGSQDRVPVSQIAAAVIAAMRTPGTQITYSGGVENGRGWKGDVKNMLLDVNKIMSLGWKARYNSLEAVRMTANAIAEGIMQK